MASAADLALANRLADAAGEAIRPLFRGDWSQEQKADSSFVTEILPFRAFKASDARFRDYYTRNREGPFCDAYIEPKLAMLRQRFAALQAGAATKV